jgi:uncharacterized protein YqgC (DUF456 family)
MFLFRLLGWLLFGTILLTALPIQILGLPGNWLLVADALFLFWFAGPDWISASTVIVLAAMALLGEVTEFWTAASGARTDVPIKGVVAASILGALVGGVLGAPVLFGLGAIPGMAVGAWSAVFLTALFNGYGPGKASEAAVGALVGRLKGTAAKVVICAAMIAVIIVSLIW